ncbi:glycosyltransferase [Lysobacter sp. GCM10012299]|uniref:glycosyltransferase n=1 Tax=Lysobacter sp. GCM10012299 TaxID=3317333 RepID=UPI003613598D
MKIIAATYGTEGDTRPLAALCHVLRNAGHDARLLADAGTLGSAHALGVPTTALAGDIRGALEPGQGIGTVVGGSSDLNATAKALAAIANTHASAWLRTILDEARDADLLLVSGIAAFVGLAAGDCLRIPVIGTGMIPLSPTRAFPSPFLPPSLVPRVLNRASHQLVASMMWRAFRASTNTALTQVGGLPARKRMWEGHPMLYGVSPSLLVAPDDWPANTLACGQWMLPSPNWTPPAELEAFLAAGEPPIYIGFGSMTGFDTQRLKQAMVAALRGRRALFHAGWSGVDTSDLPANVLAIGETAHDWLLPRTALAIHHGGSGTSHSACRAGVPSVVVPFAGDQFFWAAQMHRRGVAPPAVKGRDISGDVLAQRIDQALAAPVGERARELGARMREENGLATALAAIERLSARN